MQTHLERANCCRYSSSCNEDAGLIGEVVFLLIGGCVVFPGPRRKGRAGHGVGTHLLLSLTECSPRVSFDLWGCQGRAFR